jgi:hypothetical protein
MLWRVFINAVAYFNIDFDGGVGGSDPKILQYRENLKTSIKPVVNLALVPPRRYMLGLLGVTRRSNCSVPSDRIYGVRTPLLRMDWRARLQLLFHSH